MLGIGLPNEKYILEAVAIHRLYMFVLLARLVDEKSKSPLLLLALALVEVARPHRLLGQKHERRVQTEGGLSR